MQVSSKQASLYLASSSPRRAELLRQIGIPFNTVTPSVDETRSAGESADALVARLAHEKALAGERIILQSHSRNNDEYYVLGSDTVVVCDKQVLGKPKDAVDARRMLTLLSGRSHQVLTAVSLVGEKCRYQCLTETEVVFRRVSEAEIDAYWCTGEPADKAGAYGIQGRAGVFVERINGSYTGVVGLPLCQTHRLLCECGLL